MLILTKTLEFSISIEFGFKIVLKTKVFLQKSWKYLGLNSV